MKLHPLFLIKPARNSFKTPPHLCCHDEAGGCRVNGDITSHQSHILELLIHLPVLLVGKSLDGAGKDHPLLLSKGQCYSISRRKKKGCFSVTLKADVTAEIFFYSLSTDGLSSRRVCRHQHRLIVVNTQNSFTLKWVKNERVFLQEKCQR